MTAIPVFLCSVSIAELEVGYAGDALCRTGFPGWSVVSGRWHGVWPDPFDRMLAAQAIIEGATLVTNDATMKLFRVKCLW